MNECFDLIIKNGTVMTPAGRQHIDVGVLAGRIQNLGHFKASQADEVIDATGLHVLPGVIDSQVHFREPGLEHKEDLDSGTRSAVMGGVTAIFEMPNTSPATTDGAAIQAKLDRARGRAWCDFAFFVGAAAENVDKLAELERYPGVPGVKLFMGSSTGSLLVADEDNILKVLQNGKRRMSVHCEDEARLTERFGLVRGGAHPKMHATWRDSITALKATTILLRLARKAGRRVHVLHVTTADEMEVLAENKDLATVECTPQHLTLVGPEAYERLGTLAQMNPPIRSQEHVDGLWRAIANGVVDVIGSDHAPHTLEEKARPYPQSPSGMTGVQTLVPLLLNHVNNEKLSLERFVDLTAHGPQRIFNIAGKGRIARGYDADFTLVDMKRTEEIRNSWIESKAGWCPYDGMKVTGWPVRTVIRGRTVMADAELVARHIGDAVRFQETKAVLPDWTS